MGQNDVTKFLKHIGHTESGEKSTVEYMLDETKIAEEKI